MTRLDIIEVFMPECLRVGLYLYLIDEMRCPCFCLEGTYLDTENAFRFPYIVSPSIGRDFEEIPWLLQPGEPPALPGRQ